jgi:hypothetical protein
LDHYLPKSIYAQFAILPINLIPCCRDCNFEKREVQPALAEEQTFHPYFDELGKDRWLFSEVIIQGGVSLSFFVCAPNHWPVILQARARRHFEIFKLGKYFSTYAATELSTLRERLDTIFQDKGVDAVKADLQLEAESARRANANSWKTAAYEALAAHDQFCNGGFSDIGL